MKKTISLILSIAMLMSILSVFGTHASASNVLPTAKAIALDKSELTVPTENGTLELDVGYKFVAEHDADSVIAFAENNKYAACPMDFVITSDTDIPAGAVTIAGFYAHHDSNWVSMTPDSTFQAGTQFHLLQNIPGGPYTFNYVDVATFVKEFYCGAKLNNESAAGATMTVCLCIFPEGEDTIVIDSFSYTFQSKENNVLPTAKAIALEQSELSVPTESGTLELDVGYKFVAEHDADSVIAFAENNKYAACPMDFVLSTDKPVAAGAVTIAGFYAHHDSNWVTMTPEQEYDGSPFHLLENLPGGPYTFTYVDIVNFVREFYCGAKLNDDSAAGTTMHVELRAFPAGEDSILIDSFSYTFKAKENNVLPRAEAIELDEDEIKYIPCEEGSLDLNVGYKFVCEHNAETVIDFAKNNKYANCPMDFVITTDKDIPAGSVTLAGFYAHHDENWVLLKPENTFSAGTQLRLLEVLPGGPYTFTYVDVATFVKEFYCGARLNDNSAAGATMTVSLCVFPDGEDPIAIDSFSYTFVAHEHTWTEWSELMAAVAPTCERPGKTATEYRFCLVCTQEELRGGEEIPALGHDYQQSVVEPTCLAGGYTVNTCSRCGHTYRSDKTAALGHDIKQTVIASTCTEPGYTIYACSRCEYSYKADYTAILGHDFGEWTVTTPAVDATCETDGRTAAETRYCSRCDAAETRGGDVIAALGHDYVAAVTAPTCTEAGYTMHTCSRCSNSYTDAYTDALGHDFGEWTVTTPAVDATCETDGRTAVETRYCSRCDATETRGGDVIAALGHDYVAAVTAPTCTEAGYTMHTCSRCSNSYTDAYTDALGHDFGEWTVTTPAVGATCTQSGQTAGETRYCSRCDATETKGGEEIAALGHNYQASVTASTCTQAGYTTHTCSRCGDSYTDTYTNALGHAFGEWTVTTPAVGATCTQSGQTAGETRYCSRCDATETKGGETIAALEHDFGEWQIITAPTCVSAGKEQRICSRDASHIETREIAPTGVHSFAMMPPVPATFEHDGVLENKCAVCGADNPDVEKIVIARIATVELSTSAFSYDGTEKTPVVTAKDSLGKEIDTDNFTVDYQNNVKVGTATALVTFGGNYAGETELTFTISLAKPALKLHAVSAKAVALTWNKITGAQYYKIYEYNTNTGKYKLIAKTVKTAYTVQNKSAATAYTYVIRACFMSTDGTKEFGVLSNSVNARTLCKTPVLKAAASKNTVMLKWAKVSGAKYYRVYKYNTKTHKYSVLVSKTAKLTCTLKSQPKGNNYYLVRAFNADHAGSLFTTANFAKVIVK